MGAVHMLLLDADTSATDVRQMSKEMEDVDGVSYVLGMDSLLGSRVPEDFVPDDRGLGYRGIVSLRPYHSGKNS